MWYKLLVERFSSVGTRKGKYQQGRGNTLAKNKHEASASYQAH